MESNSTGCRGAGVLAETEARATLPWKPAEISWPRLPERQFTSGTNERNATPNAPLRVLVVGDLRLELPVRVRANVARVLDSFVSQGEPTVKLSTMDKLVTGGFVGHAVPIARALGAQVTVCATMPVPMPKQVRAFFQVNEVDWRFVNGMPGRCPVGLRVRCIDGELCIPCGGRHAALQVPDLPRAALDVDIALVGSAALTNRAMITRRVADILSTNDAAPVLGLQTDSNMNSDELALATRSGVWTFMAARDATRLSGVSTRGDGVRRIGTAARAVRERLGVGKLVVYLGDRGAILMNGLADPYHAKSIPIDVADRSGALEAFAVATTISSAGGFDDLTSVERGVAVSMAHIAHLPLTNGPRCKQRKTCSLAGTRFC